MQLTEAHELVRLPLYHSDLNPIKISSVGQKSKDCIYLSYGSICFTYSAIIIWQSVPSVHYISCQIGRRRSRSEIADTEFLHATWLRKFYPSLLSRQ